MDFPPMFPCVLLHAYSIKFHDYFLYMEAAVYDMMCRKEIDTGNLFHFEVMSIVVSFTWKVGLENLSNTEMTVLTLVSFIRAIKFPLPPLFSLLISILYSLPRERNISSILVYSPIFFFE